MAEFEPVLLTLPSLTPSLAVEVLPYGLTLHRIFVQSDGRTHDVVIGPEIPKGHVTQKYTNTVIGRYANRIPVKKHLLERNDIAGEFTAIANESPRVSLHGGPTGYDSMIWTVLTPENPPTLFSVAELSNLPITSSASSFAVFQLVSEDGDQGFPGKLILEALVALVKPGKTTQKPGNETYDLGSIVLVYRAKLDPLEKKKIVTPVNLTQHWGFNLDASLQDDSLSVLDHILTIKSDRIAELDADSLWTGKFLPTATLPSHTHREKRIGENIPQGPGYDDYYVFDPSIVKPAPTRVPLSEFNPGFDLIKDLLRSSDELEKEGRPEPVAELSSIRSGLNLTFDTNQSGVMFYSNGHSSVETGARKKIHGGSGKPDFGDAYGPGTAVFLEFHDPLTAFLDPEKKNGEDTLVTSDELYHNYVRCDVKYKDPSN